MIILMVSRICLVLRNNKDQATQKMLIYLYTYIYILFHICTSNRHEKLYLMDKNPTKLFQTLI